MCAGHSHGTETPTESTLEVGHSHGEAHDLDHHGRGHEYAAHGHENSGQGSHPGCEGHDGEPGQSCECVGAEVVGLEPSESGASSHSPITNGGLRSLAWTWIAPIAVRADVRPLAGTRAHGPPAFVLYCTFRC